MQQSFQRFSVVASAARPGCKPGAPDQLYKLQVPELESQAKGGPPELDKNVVEGWEGIPAKAIQI